MSIHGHIVLRQPRSLELDFSEDAILYRHLIGYLPDFVQRSCLEQRDISRVFILVEQCRDLTIATTSNRHQSISMLQYPLEHRTAPGNYHSIVALRFKVLLTPILPYFVKPDN